MYYTKIGDQHLIWEMDVLPAIVMERAEIVVGYNSATYTFKARNGVPARVKFKNLDNLYVVSEWLPLNLENPVKGKVLAEIKGQDLDAVVKKWCQAR